LEKRDIHPCVVEALPALSPDLQCDAVRTSRKKNREVFEFSDFLERVPGRSKLEIKTV
jgi:hypothetical protein